MSDVLAIDVGNTSVKCGLFVDEGPATGSASARKVVTRSLDDLPGWFASLARPSRVIVGSVVRDAAAAIASATPSDWPPLSVKGPRDFGLALDVKSPDRVGVDRVAAAAAAVRLAGGPCVVLDSGTAITIDVATGDTFCGGLIAPGPQMLLDALHARTDALPQLRWNEDVASRPRETLIGRDTSEAIALATRAMLESSIPGMVRQVQTELQTRCGKSVPVFRTGGAELSLDDLKATTVPDLALRGLVHAR